ncbi:GRB2-related adapter protein 2b [Scophthalmus maximus]|uniref:GRB2-related adapter protein 2b n=1 Tax=Scophthalmus maximus TaxID=52904 RepID=UPI001FA8A62A|nr:GRB2-related adapter protein 2b [Scophthalmus maximus]
MEAAAKYDFEATDDDELSFREGDQLKILQTTGNWYMAELSGVEGLVPKNFISFHLPSWYDEDAGHSEAQRTLMSRPLGAFLMWSTQNAAAGEFSLSVRHETNVQHFKVLRDREGQYYLWSEKFPSLNQLVKYYKTKSVAKKTLIFLQETKWRRGRSDSLPPLPASPAAAPPADLTLPSAPPQHDAPSSTQVRAEYSFLAIETDELGFSAGDVIEVLERLDQAWWRGRLRGKTGLFPSNYTEPI